VKSRLLFDNRIEIAAVSHGPGLRLEAIFLRRTTMIITITTNRTPAMMRIVVGSIEHSPYMYAAPVSVQLLPHVTELGTGRRPEKATQKYVENWQAAREKPNDR